MAPPFFRHAPGFNGSPGLSSRSAASTSAPSGPPIHNRKHLSTVRGHVRPLHKHERREFSSALPAAAAGAPVVSPTPAVPQHSQAQQQQQQQDLSAQELTVVVHGEPLVAAPVAASHSTPSPAEAGLSTVKVSIGSQLLEVPNTPEVAAACSTLVAAANVTQAAVAQVQQAQVATATNVPPAAVATAVAAVSPATTEKPKAMAPPRAAGPAAESTPATAAVSAAVEAPSAAPLRAAEAASVAAASSGTAAAAAAVMPVVEHERRAQEEAADTARSTTTVQVPACSMAAEAQPAAAASASPACASTGAADAAPSAQAATPVAVLSVAAVPSTPATTPAPAALQVSAPAFVPKGQAPAMLAQWQQEQAQAPSEEPTAAHQHQQLQLQGWTRTLTPTASTAASSLGSSRDHNSVTIKHDTVVKDAAGAIVKVLARLQTSFVTALRLQNTHESLNRSVKALAVARKYVRDGAPGDEVTFLPMHRQNVSGVQDPNLFAFMACRTRLSEPLKEHDETELSVSGRSDANSIANAILGVVLSRGQAIMKAGGAAAMFVAMTAVVNARQRLKRNHHFDIMLVPEFITENTVGSLGRESKFVRFNIVKCDLNGPKSMVHPRLAGSLAPAPAM